MVDVIRSRAFDKWLSGVRDRRAMTRIGARPDRLALGHFGDAEPVGGGVTELWVDYGPGYRVSCLQRGGKRVVLPCGGDKSSQARDIARAKTLAKDRKDGGMEKVTHPPHDAADHLQGAENIAAYLEAVMEEGGDDPAYVAHALGTVARARNMTALAQEVGMSRVGLNKALSAGGNPTLATVLKVAKALDLKVSFEPAAARGTGGA